MVETVCEVYRLSKYFLSEKKKKFFALKDISLSIRKGEIFGLLGPNGAGKTTFINILSTLLLPSSGSAKIFGLDVLKDQNEILKRINFVSGNSWFHWIMTPEQILDFFADAYLVENKKERIEKLVSVFEIGDFRGKRFSKLSSGQRIRVLLAKALLNSPEFLLLDEPTIGLDPNIAVKVRKHIKGLKKKGTTILLTSHYMSEVEKLCGRIAFIHRGNIMDIGRMSKLKSKEFAEFELVVVLDIVKKPLVLKKQGYKVKGKTVSKSLRDEREVSREISFLVKNGFGIKNLRMVKPTLEDYFIRMSKK